MWYFAPYSSVNVSISPRLIHPWPEIALTSPVLFYSASCNKVKTEICCQQVLNWEEDGETFFTSVFLTWALKVEEKWRSVSGFRTSWGPAGPGSCRVAGPGCSSAPRSSPAPQPPPAAPPGRSVAPDIDCDPSAVPASSAAPQFPPGEMLQQVFVYSRVQSVLIYWVFLGISFF